MPGIMVVKPEKVSMVTHKPKQTALAVRCLLALAFVILLTSFHVSVPKQDHYINLALPAYFKLRSTGGFVYLDGGQRGILVYRADNDVYYAFERACPHHPREACAKIEVHASGLYMHDACCGSSFNFNGQVTGGPSRDALARYETNLEGNILTIGSQFAMD